MVGAGGARGCGFVRVSKRSHLRLGTTGPAPPAETFRSRVRPPPPAPRPARPASLPLTRFRCSSRNLRSLCSRFCAASSSAADVLSSAPSAGTCGHSRLQARPQPRHPGLPGSRARTRPLSRPGVSPTEPCASPLILTTTSLAAAITAFSLLPATTRSTSVGQ